jgi:hypothetical protein
MRIFVSTLSVLAVVVLIGCASTGKAVSLYQAIDLQQDLDQQTLQRYQAEAKNVADAGGECHMATLEKSPWNPLGLLAYWDAGKVQTMPGKNGELYYMASQKRGFGPLSLLWVSQEDATYDANGKLLSNMAMRSTGLGMVTMSHETRTRLGGETWMTHKTSHLFHHTLNISDMDGMKGYSLFSSPNPASVGN